MNKLASLSAFLSGLLSIIGCGYALYSIVKLALSGLLEKSVWGGVVFLGSVFLLWVFGALLVLGIVLGGYIILIALGWD